MRRVASLARAAVTVLIVVGLRDLVGAAAEEHPAIQAAAERQQRVMTFVRSHSPELAEVLAHLEASKPADYARAIEELDRSVQPLTAGRAKDPRLHEMELQSWQARTRVELLGARWLATKKANVSERAALERQLREAITDELDIRAAQLAYRKQRSIAWYDRQISRLSTKRDELVTARLKSLLDR